MKPIIGVTPLWDDKLASVWMLTGYMDALHKMGALPIILPLEGDSEDIQQACALCNGFLLTGGHDVDPRIYSAPRSEKCGAECSSKDAMERVVFDYAVENDVPLLGICRGIQFINAVCGGDLYQDIPSEIKSPTNHQMTPPYDRVQHRVTISAGSPLHQILGVTEMGVNSYHHQAIRNLAPQLMPQAYSSEDGLVESIYMPGKRFIQATQWHPELSFMTDENSCKIVASFVKACKR